MSTLAAQVPLSPSELKLLQTLIYQECGMFFDERRLHFLQERLQRLESIATELASGYARWAELESMTVGSR